MQGWREIEFRNASSPNHFRCGESASSVTVRGGTSVMKRVHAGFLFLILLSLVLMSPPAEAQKPSQEPGKPLGPGWHNVQGEGVAPEAARRYFEVKAVEVEQRLAQQRMRTQSFMAEAAALPSGGAAEVTPEIEGLARGLRNDPKAIYDFVHNHIDYVPYFGSKKGATLTYLDGAGNDFDQASLMIALLRASGYTSKYVFGVMRMPGNALANWLGVDQDRAIISRILINGGIPVGPYSNGQYCYSDATCELNRVWVRVTVDGANYDLDPSYKTYNYIPKIDIGATLGYDRNQFIAAATSGATVTPDYVQNLNEANIRAKLTEYSMNFVNYIRANKPNAESEEIIGGRHVNETSIQNYIGNMPFLSIPYYYWDDVPAQYQATFRIQHEGIDHTFLVYELANKRLTITYPSSNSYCPELRLNGQLVDSGNPTTPGTYYVYTLIMDHPYAGYGGTYMDQIVDGKQIQSGGTYAITTNFGASTERLLGYAKQRLKSYLDQGLANTSEAVLGENLNITGLTYAQQHIRAYRLSGLMGDTLEHLHHYFGLVKQTNSYVIDWVGVGTSRSATRVGVPQQDVDAQVHSGWATGSALEHGVLEQMMGTDNPAVSTIKFIQLADASGEKVFYATSSNFASIKPLLLQTYPAWKVDEFETDVNAGAFLIVPEKWRNYVGQWVGSGWYDSSACYCIDGGLFGGGGANQDTLTGGEKSGSPLDGIHATPVYENENTTVGDPIQISSGAFVHDQVGLVLGGPGSLGLSHSSSYASNEATQARSLGYGWAHSNDIRAKSYSHGELGLGSRQVREAAAMIVYLYVAKDLFKNLVGCPWGSCGGYVNDSLGWPLMFVSVKWAVDQLTENAVSINVGHELREYSKMPDGSFSSPLGSTDRLVDAGGGAFRLERRFGTRWNFDSQGRISSIVDVDGNTTAFNYSGQNLSSVFDPLGRSLSFAYDAINRITAVTDSVGRQVQYTYNAAGDLVSYKDPELKEWTYSYDATHRMVSHTNPEGITEIESTYDDTDRVILQTAPRAGDAWVTYQYFYTDYQNAEVDPDGNATTYHYDADGREIGVTDALGNTRRKKYDGQSHVVETTDPRGNTTRFVYDGNQNVIKTVNALNQETNNSYDVQFHLTDVTDPLGHTTHFEYDSEHHLILLRDVLGNESTTTYYPNGLKQSTTDPRGTRSTFTYDSYGHLQTATVGSHPPVSTTFDLIGRMTSLTDQVGSTTAFQYDARGLPTAKTDPLGRTASTIYDGVGYAKSRTDRNGITSTYTYTPLGKTASVSYPDSSSASFSYDARNNLASMLDMLGTTAYSYDAANRLTSVTDPHGFTVSYEYDEAGSVISLTYPGNKTVRYTYDALNRMKTVTTWLGNIATYTYDAAGRVIRLDNFNGTYTLYGYDNTNRLTSLENRDSSGGVISTYQYVLDPAGNPTQIISDESLSPTPGAILVNYGYNTERNRLLTANSISYSYDNEGQTSSINEVNGSRSLVFDARLRAAAISGVGTFSYDGSNNRLEVNRNGTTTAYVYDVAGNLLAEAEGANTITRCYIYGNALLATITRSNELFSYHYDSVGSTIALTDRNQNIVNQYSYDPYGNIQGSVESVVQPFKYAGRYGVVAEQGGIGYMKARYYYSQSGRFLSEDPLGSTADGPNLYAYARDNPISRIDPTGLQSRAGTFEVCGIVAFGFCSSVDTEGRTRDYWGIGVDAGAAVSLGGLGGNSDNGPSFNASLGQFGASYGDDGWKFSVGPSVDPPWHFSFSVKWPLPDMSADHFREILEQK